MSDTKGPSPVLAPGDAMQDPELRMECRSCFAHCSYAEFTNHGGCPGCGRGLMIVEGTQSTYNETFDHAAQEDFKKGEATPVDETGPDIPSPKIKKERRSKNQDTAVEAAFVEGTLPEEDRRS